MNNTKHQSSHSVKTTLKKNAVLKLASGANSKNDVNTVAAHLQHMENWDIWAQKQTGQKLSLQNRIR